MSKSDMVKVKMVITEEKILANIEKVQKISKEDIVKVGQSITINTVYFLKDNGTAKEDN